MKFEVLAGKHESGGRYYKKGDVVTSERPLDEIFTNKFRKLPELEAPPKKSKGKSKGKDDETKKTTVVTKKEKRGKDVTSDFKDVVKFGGFHVFQRGTWFHIYEGEETTPINSKGLMKNAVSSFFTKFLEE